MTLLHVAETGEILLLPVASPKRASILMHHVSGELALSMDEDVLCVYGADKNAIEATRGFDGILGLSPRLSRFAPDTSCISMRDDLFLK